jgi:hypothetical protein
MENFIELHGIPLNFPWKSVENIVKKSVKCLLKFLGIPWKIP